jgi:hypothetical protein
MLPISLTEVQAFTALRAFLVSALPAGTEVIRAQSNRVAEPHGTEFVVMTPLIRERLETNIDNYIDTSFTGSITLTTLTVTSIAFGSLVPGYTLLGTNITPNTTIVSQLTGSVVGGIGTYQVSQSQTVASQKIAAGVMTLTQPTKFTVQLDIHGIFSADNAHMIATLFRDDYGVQLFQSSGFDVTPLYCDQARQIAFINGEQQFENRWSMDAVLQINPVITVPQYFADQLSATFNKIL